MRILLDSDELVSIFKISDGKDIFLCYLGHPLINIRPLLNVKFSDLLSEFQGSLMVYLASEYFDDPRKSNFSILYDGYYDFNCARINNVNFEPLGVLNYMELKKSISFLPTIESCVDLLLNLWSEVGDSDFIDLCYLVLLSRLPDNSGYLTFNNDIFAKNISKKRILEDFLHGPEFKNNGNFSSVTQNIISLSGVCIDLI